MSRLEDLECRLWEETLEDWHLTYYQTLTEPTCPLISIEPDEGSELPSIKGYIGKTGNMESDVADAIEYLLQNIETHKKALAVPNGERQ